MMQVAGVLADLDLIAEELPVVHHHLGRRAAPHREVEHHRPDPAFAVASFAKAGQHRVHMTRPRRAGRLADEPADEDAVDPVLPHPLGVQQDRSFAKGAVEPGRRAVGHLQARNVAQIIRGVLGDVGPHVDGEPAAFRPIQPLPPVREAEVRSVAGRVEPSLVAAEHLAVERRRVHVGATRSGIGMQPRLVVGRFGPGRRRGRKTGKQPQQGERRGDRHERVTRIALYATDRRQGSHRRRCDGKDTPARLAGAWRLYEEDEQPSESSRLLTPPEQMGSPRRNSTRPARYSLRGAGVPRHNEGEIIVACSRSIPPLPARGRKCHETTHRSERSDPAADPGLR